MVQNHINRSSNKGFTRALPWNEHRIEMKNRGFSLSYQRISKRLAQISVSQTCVWDALAPRVDGRQIYLKLAYVMVGQKWLRFGAKVCPPWLLSPWSNVWDRDLC